MKPTKAIKALQSMHEYLTDKVAIAIVEQREPNGYDLRNKAALEDAIGIYGKLCWTTSHGSGLKALELG